jgi:hypothetical protein
MARNYKEISRVVIDHIELSLKPYDGTFQGDFNETRRYADDSEVEAYGVSYNVHAVDVEFKRLADAVAWAQATGIKDASFRDGVREIFDPCTVTFPLVSFLVATIGWEES